MNVAFSQAYPYSKRQRTSKVDREQTKTKVAAAGNPEPLAISQTRRSGTSKNDDKGMVVYSKSKDTGLTVVTPTRELRSATRSNANAALTKVPVITPASKTRTPTSKATAEGSSPLTRSQQIEVAVTPELTWDVRRQSTRLQQKEVSQSPPDSGRGKKTPSSRFSKKEVVESSQDTLKRKTPSRSQHKVIETPEHSKALAIIPLLKDAPETRSRTRSQRLAATKVRISKSQIFA